MSSPGATSALPISSAQVPPLKSPSPTSVAFDTTRLNHSSVDDITKRSGPKHPHVSFSATISISIGEADARYNRSDIWALPNTCDVCGLYILPGKMRWECRICEEKGEGDGYDLCGKCFDSAAAAANKGKRRRKKKRKREVGFGGHEHGKDGFVLVEKDDEESD
mmetsp:Transcript_22999/g.47664  ORF Transcript_22999/g.47664 Transcript_22999/m.47664 type:complete len:164 (+) Transcript_22999:188-679(+)|eukprot:CAMPEP_0118638646 /NCGR_PEP_ID=MMETSP0785-20121206/3802_1 /TAXON_ID=91992 /ORGANISM="Bolidomonas pacifica, Strain CCMP 1866" /LENGTH=163 /DNA_ID=CAMNT_0006529923 /DNA_START=132 /DNA_END=626 /DNA_ORIENTATION=+